MFGGVAGFSKVQETTFLRWPNCCGALEALIDVNTTASIGGDPTAEVFEAVYYRGLDRSDSIDELGKGAAGSW